MGIEAAAGGAVADLVTLVFPSDCRVCGAALTAMGSEVCEACEERVGPQTGVLCARCGDAIEVESARVVAGLGQTECVMCRLAPPEFARAVAFAAYDDEVRAMLHLLKFEGRRAVAERVLGEAMAAAVLKLEDVAAGELVVVPVPLFGARERKRGFNQARLLAEAGVVRLRKLRPEWKLRLDAGVLARMRDTQALYAMTPPERRRSLRGAFAVREAERVRGLEVLLVDDIMTTGATARECSRVLLKAGAAKVWVATVARAQAEDAGVGRGSSGVAKWDRAVEPGPARGFV